MSTRTPWLLRPCLAVIGRFATTARLALLVLLLLVPGVVGTVGYWGAASSRISFAASERTGTRVVGPALAVFGRLAAGGAVDGSALAAAVQANPGLGLAADETNVAHALTQAQTPQGRAAAATRSSR